MRILIEMADEWRDEKRRLYGGNYERVDHMLKLLYYYTLREDYVNDWCKSIANLTRTSKLKPRSHYPKQSKILDAIWDPIKDDIDERWVQYRLMDLEDDGYPKREPLPVQTVYDYLKEFHEQLAYLGSEGEVRRNAVAEIAAFLVNKYTN